MSTATATSSLDLAWIRAQFPALAMQVSGRPAVFFDAPGGTQVPERVLGAMRDYLVNANSNTHGLFLTSQRTDQTIADAHAAMADLLGCDSDEVIFGQNMTSLTFALSRSIGRELRAGDEILVTTLDHDANVAPWRALEEAGARVQAVAAREQDCTLELDDLRRKLSPRTRVVAVGYASNAVGTINDVAEIVRLAHSVGALCFIDAVHYAPHGPIDVRALDCDFLACSAYKFFGPHVGVLYGKRKHLERLRAYKVRPATDELPGRWETGTQNHEGMAGVSGCVEYLADIGRRANPGVQSRRHALLAAYASIQHHERSLAERMLRGLAELPGVTLYGPQAAGQRTPTFGLRVAGHSPQELSAKLAEAGIFTWEGNFYAISLTERLGVEQHGGLLRIGLAHYATEEEVTRCLAELRRIAT